MSIALSRLVTDLASDVPQRSSVPDERQYERAVRAAVTDYGRRRPLRKLTTLSIVSGTAAYTLPDDFLKVIVLEALWSPDGVLVSSEGLIPVSQTYEERYYITGLTMTFDPTPQYTTTRDLWYAAGYVLGDDETYSDLTEEDAEIVLLKARANALRVQGNAIAGDILSYQIGDERVEKGKTVEALRGAAKGLEDEYKTRIAAAVGPVGSRATYSWAGR